MKGKIVLIPFPFTNLKNVKKRPALVILEREHDVTVAFISSKIPDHLDKYTVVINKEHLEFKLSGLKADSTIYLDKLATVKKDLISGEIGEIGSLLRMQINERLKKIFLL